MIDLDSYSEKVLDHFQDYRQEYNHHSQILLHLKQEIEIENHAIDELLLSGASG